MVRPEQAAEVLGPKQPEGAGFIKSGAGTEAGQKNMCHRSPPADKPLEGRPHETLLLLQPQMPNSRTREQQPMGF